MPSPKSGNPGSPVPPADPQKPEPADKADPGAMDEVKAEQRETQTGKYGSVPIEPHKIITDPEERKKKPSWIEIVLVDEEDKPIPGEAYQVVLPDGSVQNGSLNEKGFARIDAIDPGSCRVSFPNLDKKDWEKI